EACLLRVIKKLVDDWVSDPEATDPFSENNLQQLLPFLREQLEDLVTGWDEVELEVVVAMCLLGPAFAGIPPQILHADLLRKVRGVLAQQPQPRAGCLFDIVIAYGCGNWRTVNPAAGGWHGEWPGAFQALQRQIEPWVRQAYRRLRALPVRGLPQRTPQELQQDAAILAFYLKRPLHVLSLQAGQTLVLGRTLTDTNVGLPAQGYQVDVSGGANYILSINSNGSALQIQRAHGDTEQLALGRDAELILHAGVLVTTLRIRQGRRTRTPRLGPGDQAFIAGPAELLIWECTCGNRNCQQSHRLASWNPLMPLVNFLASAVKGPNPNIQVNTFVQGMYFHHLSWNIGLRHEPVEFRICKRVPPPGTSVCGKEYEGGICPVCHDPFDPGVTGRDARPWLIMSPPYFPEKRCRCTSCGNLFELPSSWSDITHDLFCHSCQNPLVSPSWQTYAMKARTQWMASMLKTLAAVRLIYGPIRPRGQCRYCGSPLNGICWCPLTVSHPTPCKRTCVGCLPNQETVVWVLRPPAPPAAKKGRAGKGKTQLGPTGVAGIDGSANDDVQWYDEKEEGEGVEEDHADSVDENE
ncbi:MAG: hypothetical protein JXB46_11545, partial [Candidatus Eisenbacteria bacterium]|nr:hypothetical protein [Candidatus Eisenbacteria bacterium]